MQLCALNDQGLPIFAGHAGKKIDYFCLECKQIVRLRGGFHRQDHFFHLHTNQSCNQSGKSMTHLMLQLLLLGLLPKEDCQIERRFPEINRIADVFWISRRIVFEIQCSPIRADEILQRNADYRSLGIQPIWIMHEDRYNQSRLSAAEIALQGTPHYYTDVSNEGKGGIYDQFSLFEDGIRIKSLEKIPVLINEIYGNSKIDKVVYGNIPRQIKHRLKSWPIYCKGDLIDQAISSPHSNYLSEAFHIENSWRKTYIDTQKTFFEKVSDGLEKFILRPYRIIFNHLLEKACR